MNNSGGYHGGHPRQPGPPGGQQDQIRQWFLAVDSDRSGQISAMELQRALVNGNMSKFSEETCRMLISMFDNNHSGTIDVSLIHTSTYWKKDSEAMSDLFLKSDLPLYWHHDFITPYRWTSFSLCSISSSSGGTCSRDSTETAPAQLRAPSSARLWTSWATTSLLHLSRSESRTLIDLIF